MIRTRIAELFTSVKFNATQRLLGRWSPGKGYGEEIAIGSGLSLVNGVLSATSSGTSEALPDTLVLRDENGSAAFTEVSTVNLRTANVSWNSSGITRTYANGTVQLAMPSTLSGEDNTHIISLPQASGTVALLADAVTPLALSDPPVNAGMRVTGTLTDGTDPVVFPVLFYAGRNVIPDVFDLPYYEYEYTEGSTEWYFAIYPTNLLRGWVIEMLKDGEEVAEWTSGPFDELNPMPSDPTLVTSWTPSGLETGTPVVTTIGTAGKLGQHAIVDETDVYLCTRESPVKWVQISN